MTALLLLAGRYWKSFRAWLQELPWAALVSFHLTRFVGFYFLWLYHQHQLPRAFALPAGIGDLAVAIWAVILLVSTPAVRRRPGFLLGWNIFGLADILMVIADAAIIGRADPAAMRPLLQLPLSLLPTFIVPIILASHVWLFAKTKNLFERRNQRATSPSCRSNGSKRSAG
jgi:hypothetical protein